MWCVRFIHVIWLIIHIWDELRPCVPAGTYQPLDVTWGRRCVASMVANCSVERHTAAPVPWEDIVHLSSMHTVVTPNTDFYYSSWNWLCYHLRCCLRKTVIYCWLFFVVTFYYRYIYILYIQILVWIDWKNKWVITHFSQPCVGGFASVWFICYLHKSGPLVLWDWIHVSYMVYMYLYLYCVVFST